MPEAYREIRSLIMLSRMKNSVMSQHSERTARVGSVLVIDDEPDIRKVVRIALEKSGLHVLEAEDSSEALAFLGASRDQVLIEAIITEIQLSDIHGQEALSYFQQQFPGIPIVILTAHYDIDIRTLLLNEGIVDCLFKPVEGDRLTIAINRAIKRHQISRI